jgi:hypothetical protein
MIFNFGAKMALKKFTKYLLEYTKSHPPYSEVPSEVWANLLQNSKEIYWQIINDKNIQSRNYNLGYFLSFIRCKRDEINDHFGLKLIEVASHLFWYRIYAPITYEMVADLFEADIELINKYLNSNAKNFDSLPEAELQYKAHEQRLEELMAKDPVLKEMVLNRRWDPMGY